jgi:hypothetical protein
MARRHRLRKEDHAVCQNCGHANDGAFCSNCGQAHGELGVRSLPQVIFLMVPWLALLLLALFRSKTYYVEHLVVALHLHAFAFALFTISQLITWYRESKTVYLITALTLLSYAFVALRRVYGTSIGGTLWRGLIVGVGYGVAIASAATVALFYTILHL